MKRSLLFAVPVLIVGAAAVFVFGTRGNKPEPNLSTTEPQTQERPRLENSVFRFADQRKARHYVSSNPEHAVTLAEKAAAVTISFNFDLAKPSSISVKQNGKEYAIDETIISADKLTLSRELASELPDGLYEVTYRACWPDATCHNGLFQFAIKQ